MPTMCCMLVIETAIIMCIMKEMGLCTLKPLLLGKFIPHSYVYTRCDHLWSILADVYICIASASVMIKLCVLVHV